jgi:hypothetical protein
MPEICNPGIPHVDGSDVTRLEQLKTIYSPEFGAGYEDNIRDVLFFGSGKFSSFVIPRYKTAWV